MTTKGTVVRYIPDRGFGFVQVARTKESIFFHVNDVAGKLVLQVGDLVEFQIEPNSKGGRAVSVKLIAGAPAVEEVRNER